MCKICISKKIPGPSYPFQKLAQVTLCLWKLTCKGMGVREAIYQNAQLHTWPLVDQTLCSLIVS